MKNRNALSGQIRDQVAMTPVQDDQVLDAIDVGLGYDPADPYAVRLTFGPPAGHPAAGVAWTFARDLLLDGTTTPTGDGDVQVWPCLDVDGCATVVIDLRSPAGELALQVRTKDLNGFLERILVVVPRGVESEHLDLAGADAWLASITESPESS